MDAAFDDFLDIQIMDSAFTLIEVPGFQTVWETPHRLSKGVYLWCVEYNGAYLASYVGKTNDRGGFERRLGTEHSDWRRGRYCPPVEIEAFLRGERITIATPPIGHLASELAAIEPATRILLVPLASDAECGQVESHIVNELRRHSFTFEFLGNLDKKRKYTPKPSPVVRVLSAPPIIGLTCPVPVLESPSV